MATSELPARSGPDLNGIVNLAGLFTGKDTSTGGTTTGSSSGGGTRTTTSNVSQAHIDATVRSILEGSQGLANVTSGQNRAGMYNSSTNRMLVNDLIARAAAEGAKLRKTETTRVSENQNTVQNTNQRQTTAPQIKPSTGAMVLGGLSAFNTVAKTGVGKSLLSKLGLGLGNTGSASAAPSNTGGINGEEDIDFSGEAYTVDNPNASFAADGSQSVGSLDGLGSFGGGQSVGSNAFSAGSVFGSDAIGGDSGGGSGYDFDFGFGGDLGTDVSDAGGGFSFDDFGGNGDMGGDWGVDPNTIDYGDVSYDVNDLFSWADGGLVTRHGNERTLRRLGSKPGYARGGYVNLAAEKAFNSGGPEDSEDKGDGKNFKRSADIDREPPPKREKTKSESETYAPKKNAGQKILEFFKRPGFATGGMVDLTNIGLRTRGPQAVNSLGASGNDQLITSVVGGQQQQGENDSQGKPNNGENQGSIATPGSVNTAGLRATMQRNQRELQGAGDATSNATAANASPGTGANSGIGVAGAGTIGSVVGGLTATPGLGTVTGLANASNNNQAVASVVSAMIGLVTNPVVAFLAQQAINAGSTSQSNVDADVANAVSALNDTDPLDALVSIIDGRANGANSAATNSSGLNAESGGGVGTSSGDGVGTGGGVGGSGGGSGAGDSAGAAAGLKNGGAVKGPGTATSDSIEARLSDGEYVINAAAVQHFGKDFFDMINESIKPAPTRAQARR